MEETLQDKINRVIALTGITVKELAYDLGVARSNLYKWKASANPRDHHVFDRMVRKLDKILANPSNFRRINEIVYSIENSKDEIQPLFVSIYLNQDDLPELYTGNSAIPGSVIDVNGKTALIAYRNSSPLFGNADGLITIAGDSMAPVFKNGSIIAIKKAKSNKMLVAGNYYFIIDTDNVGLLRRVVTVEDEKEILLVSDNGREHPPLIRNLNDIQAIFKIVLMIIQF
jgi:hypothetical protein